MSAKTVPGLKPAELQKLARLAVDAAHAAGKVLKKHFEKRLTIREKPGAGLVTNADLAAERAALKILEKGRPDFGILTEESAPDERTSRGSRGRWVLDPLDGTTNFAHAFPMFCVSIAAEWEGRVVVGAIYHPILNDTYLAIRGQGATVNGKRMHVSKRAKIKDSLLTTGFTYRKDEWLRQEMEAFERLSAIARAVRRPGSAALDLAYVARGVFDAFWERRLSPWDVAAGSLLVLEAGGQVTDFQGREFRITEQELLSSNGLLHEELKPFINRR